MHLHLLLTGRCNLDCDYCFQTDRRVRARMGAATAEAALDAVLGMGDPPHSVVLSGGEPFLAPRLVRRVVSWIRAGGGGTGAVDCTVLTNGSLITDAEVDFLAHHDVALQVSFDGVGSAQDRRAPGTQGTIRRRLERALERQPAWAQKRLSVAMIVQAVTVPVLARSVGHLLSMGIGDIQTGALTTHDPSWSRSVAERLEEQVEGVVRASRRLWERTGEVPVGFLKPDRGASRSPGRRPPGALCGVTSPESVTVDPDGRGWACPAFVGSIQKLPPEGREACAHLDLGDVRAPGFRRHVARLPRKAGGLPLLRDKEKKWSVRGPCRVCGFFAVCRVCPASTMHVPGNSDPHRVPDHQCDFQFATSRARRRFLAQTASSFAPPFWTGAPLAPASRRGEKGGHSQRQGPED